MTTPEATTTVAVLRLDRSRRRWRFWALVLGIFFLLTLASVWKTDAVPERYVARVDVTGLILENPYALDVLADIATDPAVQALWVHVDSPGGTMGGGLSLHTALREVAAKKPVVVTLGEVAASAGYMVATGGDHIISSPATLTASIGVLLPLVDATGLASKIGIRNDEVTSGALKSVTSPLYTRSASDRKYLASLVAELNDQFTSLVKERRELSDADLAPVADGRVVSGRQALALKLVDSLGGPTQAREWLEKTHKIDQTLPVVPYSLAEALPWYEEVMSSLGWPGAQLRLAQHSGALAIMH
jgi:protease-4